MLIISKDGLEIYSASPSGQALISLVKSISKHVLSLNHTNIYMEIKYI